MSKFSDAAVSSRCDRVLGAPAPKMPTYSFRGQNTQPPSLVTMEHNTAPTKHGVYTGSAMLGIGQLHKSNAVPIFAEQDAVDIARMRR